MKRITFGGGSIVTGNAVTEALLNYMTTTAEADKGITVDVTVLEDNGQTSIHTILLGPASQFDVSEVDGMPQEEEASRFPVPELPKVGIQGTVESNDDARRTAEDVDRFTAEIDNGLGR